MTTAAPMPNWLDTTQFPFENHYLDIDRNIVPYVDEGRGLVIVLLHGSQPSQLPSLPAAYSAY